MAFDELICYSLRLLIILLSCAALTTQADDDLPESQPTEVFLSQFVEPFDYRVWVGKQKYEKHYPHIGSVKHIGNLLSQPHFFSTSFGIFSREGNTSIKLEPTRHCTLMRRSGADYRICNDYEFNLAKLAPESNVFDPKKRTIIIVPGFKSTDSDYWPRAVREKWLELEDVNVINVYWPEGCHGTYFTAVSNSRIAARQINILLYYLAQMYGIDFGSRQFRRNIHIIGHSLGAHLAGAVGEELRGQVGRIIGLDPAGPAFDSMNPDERLDASDALLVDVLHTNAGSIDGIKSAFGVIKKTAEGLLNREGQGGMPIAREDSWWGINYNCGHLDYWINGGSEQPGCWDPIHHCDHMRATDLYINALDYEIQARRAFGPESPIIKQGKHRLRAFKAKDFEKFKSSQSIPRNCPSLLRSSSASGSRASSGGVPDNSQIGCAFPIDFIADPETYREELTKQFGLTLKTRGDEKRRLFFETSATEPLLSDQHLMRIHLKQKVSKSCLNHCFLNVTARARDNPHELYSVVARELDLIPVRDGEFYGLSIPFANPINWRSTFPTPETVSEHLTHYEESPDQELWVRQLVPDHVEMMLGCEKPNRLETVFGAKPTEKCQLEIEALEVKPLATLVDNVSSWYLSESQKEKVPLRRQVVIAAESRDLLAELSPATKSTATFYLTMLGIGRE